MDHKKKKYERKTFDLAFEKIYNSSALLED